MNKLMYDNLLKEYLDESGKLYEGLVEVSLSTGKAKKYKVKKRKEQKHENN